ncbi:hypothetical protein N7510_010500 [Penicillium lagena]|uniref:uncharacterized protein n=1 Tax=Penicillium lagena TaxID=94218 RepID=UPI0025417589|nr:uncharacterized protein N7510_010500 [Penicillium lagena]KAJ5605346.1 hypothetical protein N7510_010500 [Penicillium lagena]
MKILYIAITVLSAARSMSHNVVFNGTGFGTYYYDVAQVDVCGTSFSNQNLGDVECSFTTGLSLDDIASNYVVAMNHTQLVQDPAKYCGKRVVVSVNGQRSSHLLFIGDGCVRCAQGSHTTWNPEEAAGLDFSCSVLDELMDNQACNDGYARISWEIIDQTLYQFNTTDIGASRDPVSASTKFCS